MDIPNDDDIKARILPKKTIPFFEGDDFSSPQSESNAASFRWDSLLEKSFSFFWNSSSGNSVPKLEFNALKSAMIAWNAHKPSEKKDCLPYNDVLIANNPFLNFSPYAMTCETSFANVIALLANSVRREIADMYVYILPGLLERSSNEQLSREDCLDLRSWWCGFAEYLFCVLTTTSSVLRGLNDESAGEVAQLSIPRRNDLKREYNRCIERLLVTSEIPLKLMQAKVRNLVGKPVARSVIDIKDTWSCLSSFVLQTLDDCFHVARGTEFYSCKQLSAGRKGKILQGMLVPLRNFSSADTLEYEANIIISMTRWMKDETGIVEFTNMFFKKNVVRALDDFVKRYIESRRIFEFQFNRKPHSIPQRKPHNPSKVTFNLPP